VIRGVRIDRGTLEAAFLLPPMFLVRERAQQTNHGMWKSKARISDVERLSWIDSDSWWGLLWSVRKKVF
jgi:hypothetical protein